MTQANRTGCQSAVTVRRTRKILPISNRGQRNARRVPNPFLVRYRENRSYGHGPIVAAMATPTIWQVLAISVIGGVIGGLFL